MLKDALIQAGMNIGWATFIDMLLGVVLAASIGMIWILLGIWIERKWAGRFQNRIGPNRVGPYGIFQSVADALKLLTKEVIVPRNADRPVYFAAPMLAVISVILIAAVIPFSSVVIGTDLNIGLLYVLAVSSMGVIAVMMAGWGSNNKYALLGAFRVVAQLISYEVPTVLAAIVPVMLAGTLSMQGLVEGQAIWYIFAAPFAALLFFIASQAELGRAPFDLLEAESELVAGFNIEYSGMAFAMFYLAEFMHSFYVPIIFSVLFLGGWRGPGAEQLPILGMVYLLIKSILVYFVSVWLRLTVPRVRIDQLLNLNWKILVPTGMIYVIFFAFLLKIAPVPDLEAARAIAAPGFEGVASGVYRLFGPDLIATLPQAGVLLLGNIVFILGTLAVLRERGRRARLAAEGLEAPQAGQAFVADSEAAAAK